MDIRHAILAAADKIEKDPDCFDFFSYAVPASPQYRACYIGWVGHFLGEQLHGRGIHNVLPFLGVARDGVFYARMREVSGKDMLYSRLSPVEKAKNLRMYAEIYHPQLENEAPELTKLKKSLELVNV